MSEPWRLSLLDLGERLRGRELSPVDVTRALLERIEALDRDLQSFLTLLPERALDRARRAEQEIARGELRGPLHGVPVAVKDLFATRGVRTTCASKILADFVPDEDAAVVERLEAAGAVLLGKLNMTEFALSGYHPELPRPVNPWSKDRWPGVSSSGSAVAVAAGLCFGSLGTDTGGSIRFPAACCGVVGLKPTYGRVPRHGVFPLAVSLDHVGPFARRTGDAAAILGAVAGFDPRDATSLGDPVPDLVAALPAGVRRLRVGVDERYCSEGVEPRVADAVRAAAGVLESRGAELREVRMPDVEEPARRWWVLCASEAAAAHARWFPERAEEYGPDFRRTLERGAALRGADYAGAHAVRLAFRTRLRDLFDEVDLIVCPAMPVPAPRLEEVERQAAAQGGSPLFMRFTAPFDMSGSPTLTLPCGAGDEGLPIPLQLVAPDLREDLLVRAGHAFEEATEWHRRAPPGI